MWLADYADRSGKEGPRGVEITLRRTQEELSLELGTARESVSRAMKQLRQKGVIESLGRNRILIPDVARLRSLHSS
jgi:CRP-like cAMP-binding protein